MVFTTQGLVEIALKSWSERHLNPGPLNSTQALQPTELSGHKFILLLEPALYNHSNFIGFFSIHVSFQFLASSVVSFALREVSHR